MSRDELKSQIALGEDSRRQFKHDVTNECSILILSQGVRNSPSFRSWMPESSVQGWQTTAYGKPIVNLRLHIPVTGFLHPCWNDGVLPKMRIAVTNADALAAEMAAFALRRRGNFSGRGG